MPNTPNFHELIQQLVFQFRRDFQAQLHLAKADPDPLGLDEWHDLLCQVERTLQTLQRIRKLVEEV